MALTVEQQLRRKGKLTASMLPILMSGDEAALLRLYREEIGEIEREPPNYAMQLGSMVEHFVLDYTQIKTGNAIARRGEVVDHPTIAEFCCTLDGYRAKDDAVIECKFLAPFWPREQFVPHYYPQVLAQMRCTSAARGVLLVARGTNEPEEYDLTPAPDDAAATAYEREMWGRVAAFLLCLRTFTPPVAVRKVIAPEFWRTIDLADEPMPNWGTTLLAHLQVLEATREASAEHARAGDEARKLVPDDVSTVLAGEHRLSRNKRGAVSIRRRSDAYAAA